jgi:hypothetical protein
MDNETGHRWRKQQITFYVNITVDLEGEPYVEFGFEQLRQTLTWDRLECQWSELPSALCEALHEALSFDILNLDGVNG